MRLTVIGSADAFNSGGRGHSCYLLESPGLGRLMVDFGPTALAGLRRAGFAPNDLAGIAFTHLHGDHLGGLPFLLIDALYHSFRTSTLELLGPTLARASIDALVNATYGDVQGDVSRLSLTVTEALPGETHSIAGYRVVCHAADHMKPPHRPLCLRIEDDRGHSVAFSGDTRFCPGLFAAAEGADLLVAECTRMAPPAGSHCTFEEWTQAFDRVRARSLLLTHLGTDVREHGAEALSRLSPPLPVEFAEDGKVIELG